VLIKMSAKGPALDPVIQSFQFQLSPNFVLCEIGPKAKLLMKKSGRNPDSIRDKKFHS